MNFKEFIESEEFYKFKTINDLVRKNVYDGQSGPVDDLKGDMTQFLPTHKHREIPDFWVMIVNNPKKDGFVKFAGKSMTNGKQMTGGEPSIEEFNKRFEPLSKKNFGHLN